MTLKAALTGLLALALALPACSASTDTSPSPAPAAMLTYTAPEVPLVNCKLTAGSAFRISPTLLVTARHVAVGAACEINGEPLKVIYSSKTLDYSILKSATPSPDYLAVSCDGFQAGQLYVAIGHARGMSQVLSVPLMGTGHSDAGEALLVGILTAQPGQSGGPVIDATTGKVVGIVNAADWENGITESTALKDTPVCKVA